MGLEDQEDVRKLREIIEYSFLCLSEVNQVWIDRRWKEGS